MYRHLLEPIAREFKGKRAWLDVSRLWQFRNTVMTPGLREACRYCVRRFKENGIADARMIPYPADGKTRYGYHPPMPLEWEARSATLSIVRPKKEARRLTSYEEEALSLACRSAATPRGGVEAQVVIVKDGTKPEHYKGLNVKGKIVMTDRQAGTIAALAAKAGAIGIVSDTFDRPAMPGQVAVRENFDGPDAVQWTVLRGTPETKHLFGFVLSPRQGARLRRLIETSEKPVILRAEVDARSYVGHSDVVDGAVQGTGEGELWALAHISEPGAYDNASGLAVSLEIARTLEAMIRKGFLRRPKRTIRFLFSTEVTGFLPYLEQHKRMWAQVLAGLCIDSVGVDMGKIGGEFIIYRSPESAPSFIEHLTAEIAEAVHNMRPDLFGENNYALWPWRLAPFWGNDAFITDAYFDIPTPQLSCWPYRFYHTSCDLPEFISPDNLARTGVLCAAVLYFLANAGPREAAWVSALAAAKAKTRIAEEMNAEALRQEQALTKKTREALANTALKLERCAEYYGQIEREAALQPLRMAPKSEAAREAVVEEARGVAEATSIELENARILLGTLIGEELPGAPDDPPPPEAEEARKLVPKRNAWRIPEEKLLGAKARKALAELRARPECKGVNFADVWPWADGRRSLYNIWRRLRYKRVYPLQAMIDFFKIMAKARVVRFVKREA
jgi:hypothetical protein